MAGRRRRRPLVSPPEAEEEEEEVDHISRLPDAIIHHIFSFLPFKDVVKTSVLSKQWRFAWTSTPYIDLAVHSERVVPLISQSLGRCTAAKIEKFHLLAAMSNLFTHQWFHFAAARGVEDASLGFYQRRWNYAPPIIWNCASLVSLRLSGCYFSGNGIINWPSLKKLFMHDVLLYTDDIMGILSVCLVLESLVLLSPGCRNVRMDSRSLRELVIEDTYMMSLDISAPNLLSLRLSGDFLLRSFRLNVVSPLLAEAELNISEGTPFLEYIERSALCDQWKLHLEQLQHVAKIKIGAKVVQVLSAAERMGMSYLSSRWRNIVVYTTVCKPDLLGMAYLLRSSPILERLVICNPKSNEVPDKKKYFPELWDFDEKQFWGLQEFHCVANHLKRVEIIGFEFGNERSKHLLALAKFLLKEAVRLEKMIIDIELRMLSRGVPTNPRGLWYFHDVIQQQKGCPRASQNAEVIIDYRLNGLSHELCKHKRCHKYTGCAWFIYLKGLCDSKKYFGQMQMALGKYFG